MIIFVVFLTILALPLNFARDKEVTNEEYDLVPPVFKLDDYDGCLLRQNTTYCYAKIQAVPNDAKNSNKIWNIIEVINKSPDNYRHDWLRHGICVSNSSLMTEQKQLLEELSKAVKTRFQSYGLKGNLLEVHCEGRKSPYEFDIYNKVFGAFLILYVIFVITSSFLVYFKNEQKRSSWWDILSAFSLLINFKRLKSTTQSVDGEFLGFMQGIRFISTFLVIMGHTIFISQAAPVFNTNFFNLKQHLIKTLVYIGITLLETYFVMAGWLLSYNFCLIFERYKTVNASILIMAYIYRLLRLTPVLALTVAFHSTFLVHFGRGPVWDLIVGTEYRHCRKNWWTNLLYINNYYDSNNMCMQHTWYLAADTQAYLISLILLTLIWKFRKQIKIILGTSLLCAVLLPGMFNYFLDYDSIFRLSPEHLYDLLLNNIEWLNYAGGHTHLGAYVIGLIYGLLFYRYRGKNVFAQNTAYVILRWFFSFISFLLIAFSGKLWFVNGFSTNKFWSAFFLTINNSCVALIVGLFMFSLSQGEGWCLKWLCEWKPLIILGRITYSAYIVHFGMIKAKTALTRHPVYLNRYLSFIDGIADVTSAFAVAFLLRLFVEMPITGILKLLTSKESNKNVKNK